jgi:hypothetical protein
MGEKGYSSAILDFGIRCSASTPGERALGIHWVGPGAGPDAVKWRTIKQDLLFFHKFIIYEYNLQKLQCMYILARA